MLYEMDDKELYGRERKYPSYAFVLSIRIDSVCVTIQSRFRIFPSSYYHPWALSSRLLVAASPL